ncbi:MAG: radical SAM protein, partial [Candidatus Pacebacteria bacterium]|nr:radical SAM protein [Candidatus Paceibacterota bacterium]
PESLTHEKLQVLCDGGVNRLSIGIQSFNPVHRQTLLRRGSPAAYQNILRRVRESGFTNVNVDLIYGIPGQTVADWMMDVSMALDYGVTHLSTYGLTLEEGTALATKPCVRVEDAVQVDMWEAAGRLAAARGLRRYEVSNLAIPGKECGHNLAIWYGATYLGCGPAASSFDGAVRWTNPADLDVWLRGAAPMYDELAPNLRAAELLAFGLRTTMGWDLAVFQEQTGFDAMTLRGDAIESLAADGLLQVDGSSLCPTERGLLFADTIAVRLLQ